MAAAAAPPNSRGYYQFFQVDDAAEYVKHVQINRPERLNAFHDPMWGELKTIFEDLSTDPDVRCVLLSGAGDRAFTTGLDVTAATMRTGPDNNLANTTTSTTATDSDPSRKANSLRKHILDLQSSVSAISSCNKPVIALMHGYCYGLGVDLATACDIRLCSRDARFSVKEVDIGLAADVGTLSRLPQVMGGTTSWVKEVCLSGREFGAEEACQVGFVSRSAAVVTSRSTSSPSSTLLPANKSVLIEDGMQLAKLIAGKSPVAVQGTKSLLNQTAGRSVEDHLRYTAVWNSAMLQSRDLERAMGSVLQRRKPTFEKL